jgi:hypothetical protein
VVSSWHGLAPEESGGFPLLSRDHPNLRPGRPGCVIKLYRPGTLYSVRREATESTWQAHWPIPGGSSRICLKISMARSQLP